MEKEHFIQLTTRLYRLTLLFPKKEPLRYKIRELADDILTKCLKLNFEQDKNPKISIGATYGDLEVLDSFFEVAKSQNWVSPAEILEIQREYSNVKEGLKSFEEKERKGDSPGTVPRGETGGVKTRPRSDLGGRQQKILEILKEKGKVQVWEIKKIIPEVSKRTLRRDFDSLFRQGLIERRGERNVTYYQLKIGQQVG